MMEMQIKTRKPHDCCFCGESIPAGSIAYYSEGRYPKYDDDDNQIGIEFVRSWGHPLEMLCANEEPQRSRCLAGEHSFEVETEHDHDIDGGRIKVGVPTGNEYCSHCGFTRPITD